MASDVPVMEKKLMDDQTGERQPGYWGRIPPLPALLEYFKVTIGIQPVCQCEERKCAGVSTLLAASMLFNDYLSYKELQHGWLCKYHWRGPVWKGTVCIPHHSLCAWHRSLRNASTAETFHILMEKMPNKRWLVQKFFKYWKFFLKRTPEPISEKNIRLLFIVST